MKLSIISDHVTHSTSTGHKESSHDSKRILSVPETNVPSDSFWTCNSSNAEEPCSGQFTVRGIALGTSRLMVTSIVPGLLQSKPITVQSNIVEIQVSSKECHTFLKFALKTKHSLCSLFLFSF